MTTNMTIFMVMNKDYKNITKYLFDSLATVKAKLSAYILLVQKQQQILVITQRGKPAAVLLAYDEFQKILKQESRNPIVRSYTIEDWEAEQPNRIKVRDSITKLFDIKSLSRKGQKPYKAKKTREYKLKDLK